MKADKKSDFVKNTFSLASSNLIAQIITLLFMPVITRIYTPSEFGIFAIIMSITLPFIAVSNLRYSEAIMLAETERESDILGYLCLVLCILIGLLAFVPFIVLHDLFVASFNLSSNPKIILFIPLVIIVFGAARVVKIWLQRKNDFKAISISNVAASVIDRFSTISMGLIFGALPVGLLIGKLTGGLLTLFVCLPILLKYVSHDIKLNASLIVEVKRLLVRFIKFAKYSWTAILQQSSTELPVFMFGLYYAPEVAGFYALARRVLVEPAVVIGDALSRSFYQRAAKDHRDGTDYSKLVIKLIDYLLKLVVVPIIVFSIVAPDVFDIVFGEKWHQSGIYMQYLLPMFVMGFIMQSIGVLFNVLEKQKEWTLFVIVNFIIVSLVLIVGGLNSNESITIILFSVVSTIIIFSRILWLCKQIGVSGLVIVTCFIRAIVKSLVFGVPLIVFKFLFPESQATAVLMCASAIVIYCIFTVMTDSYLKEHFFRLLHKAMRR